MSTTILASSKKGGRSTHIIMPTLCLDIHPHKVAATLLPCTPGDHAGRSAGHDRGTILRTRGKQVHNAEKIPHCERKKAWGTVVNDR
jgi:hypothetical protein